MMQLERANGKAAAELRLNGNLVGLSSSECADVTILGAITFLAFDDHEALLGVLPLESSDESHAPRGELNSS